MSITQELIMERIVDMSESDAQFLLEIINRLIPGEKAASNRKKEAFARLEALRGGFPADFNPEQELAEGRSEKYKDG